MAKLITLAAPTTIANVIKTPLDGPQIVTDEQAVDLAGHGLLEGDAIDLPDEPALATPERKAKRG